MANLRPEFKPDQINANNLARLAGYTRIHMVETLAGRRTSDRVWQRLADLLGVTVADLRGEAPPLVEASAGKGVVARVS